MIQVNLIPDVKNELLKARSFRLKIVTICIFASMIAGGIVLLLAMYVFAVQTVIKATTDTGIKEEYEKLSQVEDLSKLLTLQNQLDEISSLEKNSPMTSRVFDTLATIVPTGKNKVAISVAKLNVKDGSVTLEVEAVNGFEALEVFKKTIEQTKFEYKVGEGENAKRESVDLLASPITEGERNYGQNSRGQRVLRFILSFEYAPELLDSQSQDGKVVAPSKQNATDSKQGVPRSLFTDKIEEDK